MTTVLKFGKMLIVLSALGMLCSSMSFAQQGSLRGGSLKLSNATNTLTLGVPGSVTSHTITFPVDTANGVQYLYDDGTGTLNWGNPISDTSTGIVLYNTDGPQILLDRATPLFNVAYTPGASGPAAGALISVVGNGPSNTTLAGLTDTARNIKVANGSGGTVTALFDTTANAGSGTQTGLTISATGGGNNYAALIYSGRTGIGTGTPTDSLDVNGNIRISGVKGLKINEGTNATMGTATANGVTNVVVATTKVTATSRIFLTAQTAGAGPGELYITARTAGTSFSFKSTSATDNSTVAWIIIEP